jgi:hypothetical protein
VLRDETLPAGDAPTLPLHPVSRRHPAFPMPAMSVAWMTGAIAFVVFVLVNVGLYAAFANRVYPGVKVGQVAVGGEPLSSLRERLSDVVPKSSLKVGVEGLVQEVELGGLMELDIDRLEREVRDVGRTTPLPIAGVIRSMLSRPVSLQYRIDDQRLGRAVTDLAGSVNRRASDAVLAVVNGAVVMVPEKPGAELDEAEAAAAIRAGIGQHATLQLKTKTVAPKVTAASYQQEAEDVKARLNLHLEVKVKSAVYSPTVQHVGGWLVVGEPGKGVVVDGPKVADFVTALPGKFDREAATNALIGAVQAKKGVVYIASTGKNVPAPKLPAVAATHVVQYGYCVQGNREANASALTAAAADLNGRSDVTLGGRLRLCLAEAIVLFI